MTNQDDTGRDIILHCTVGAEDERFFRSRAKKVVYVASFMLTDALKHGTRSEIEWTCQNYHIYITPRTIPTFYKNQSCFLEGAALSPKNSFKSDLNCFRTQTGGNRCSAATAKPTQHRKGLHRATVRGKAMASSILPPAPIDQITLETEKTSTLPMQLQCKTFFLVVSCLNISYSNTYLSCF